MTSNFSLGGETNTKDLFEKYKQAVAKVEVYYRDIKLGHGTGFFIEKNGEFITNRHVVELALQHKYDIRFFLSDGKKVSDFEISNCGSDYNDICLLKLPVKPKVFFTLNNEKVSVGEKIYAIGHPKDYDFTLSEGLVSGVRSSGSAFSSDQASAPIPTGEPVEYVQVTAPISQGSSGGPLFTSDGRVIAMATLMRIDPGSQNLNFGLSSTSISKYVAANRNFLNISRYHKNLEKKYQEIYAKKIGELAKNAYSKNFLTTLRPVYFQYEGVVYESFLPKNLECASSVGGKYSTFTCGDLTASFFIMIGQDAFPFFKEGQAVPSIPMEALKSAPDSFLANVRRDEMRLYQSEDEPIKCATIPAGHKKKKIFGEIDKICSFFSKRVRTPFLQQSHRYFKKKDSPDLFYFNATSEYSSGVKYMDQLAMQFVTLARPVVDFETTGVDELKMTKTDKSADLLFEFARSEFYLGQDAHAHNGFKVSCNSGYAPACEFLKTYWKDGSFVGYESLKMDWSKQCQASDVTACRKLILNFGAWTALRPDLVEAVFNGLSAGCNKKNKDDCWDLLLTRHKYTKPIAQETLDGASKVFSADCAKGLQLDCYRSAYVASLKSDGAPGKELDALCKKGLTLACVAYAAIAVTVDQQLAMQYGSRACSSGWAQGCYIASLSQIIAKGRGANERINFDLVGNLCKKGRTLLCTNFLSNLPDSEKQLFFTFAQYYCGKGSSDLCTPNPYETRMRSQ